MYNLKRTIYSTISVVALGIFSPLPALAQIKPAEGNLIRGAAQLDNRLQLEAQRAINNLTYQRLNQPNPTTIIHPHAEYSRIRIDLQSVLSDGTRNIQVQTGRSSIAGVLIPGRYFQFSREDTQREVLNATKRALNKSLNSGRGNGGAEDPNMYRLEGDPSNEPREDL